MASQLFIILGILIQLSCIYLFYLYRKKERLEFGVVPKKINTINNIYHMLISLFFLGYIAMLHFVRSVDTPIAFEIILSQILFWGAVFVALTILMLKVMLDNIIKTKLNQIDELTSLNTKIAGSYKIDELLINSISPLYLAIIDIDNFKKVNDIYGHIVGDEVLVKFSKIIKDNIKSSEMACRFGGDEFVICFVNREEEDVLKVLNEIRESFNLLAQNYPKSKMSISAGVASGFGLGAGGAKSYTELMLDADKALYHVKKNSKNAIHIFSEKDGF